MVIYDLQTLTIDQSELSIVKRRHAQSLYSSLRYFTSIFKMSNYAFTPNLIYLLIILII